MSETHDARTNTEQRDMDTDSVETEQKAARTSDDERLTTADLVREADDVDKSSTGDTDQACLLYTSPSPRD